MPFELVLQSLNNLQHISWECVKEYTDKELMGKQIAVIVNLAPKKFKGEVSEGMLLAAEDGHISTANVSLLHPDKEVTNGSAVH